jgi:hypothetical protein
LEFTLAASGIGIVFGLEIDRAFEKYETAQAVPPMGNSGQAGATRGVGDVSAAI